MLNNIAYNLIYLSFFNKITVVIMQINDLAIMWRGRFVIKGFSEF